MVIIAIFSTESTFNAFFVHFSPSNQQHLISQAFLVVGLDASTNNLKVRGSCLRRTEESEHDETGLWLTLIERGEDF
jgi:hypothetical protein